MPFGLAQNGLVFGFVLIVWSSLTSAFGLYLQNKVAKYTDQRGTVSYFSLAQLTYPKLSILFDSAISIKCFGVGVSYLVVIGDLMPKIMETLGQGQNTLLMHRNFWITIFMAVVVTPLSYLKKMDSLKYTSFIALFSVAYLICLVVEKYFALVLMGNASTSTTTTTTTTTTDLMVRAASAIPQDITWFGPRSLQKTLSSFPMFVFAYTCHQNMFAILNELQPHPTSGSQTRQSNLIIRNAIATALASYLVVGIFGYLTFGSTVNANIISMYPSSSISSLVGRLCIVVMVSLSFPLQCHPCRGSVNHVIHFIQHGVDSLKMKKSKRNNTTAGYTSLSSDIESVASSRADTEATEATEADESFISTTPMEGAHDTQGHDPIVVPLTTRKFYAITTAIVVLSYAVAISVTNLAKVLAFVGSTGSVSISFLLPGLFGYLLIKPSDGEHESPQVELTPLEKFCKYGGLALAIWGGAVMVICLSATLLLGATH
ncbi:uncharacterized protein LODBEIA_P41590 [Lodderomyces beijingensis]|uniref:Amino acid transporter transmembrane domain-containing protein n=1 Tax=Lodderomyces beijingensis TaxID=1775926 RepID=A0ABP0ZRV8_9ASCO